MKKQKGFTLIELLAVIVILAVIALIATPLIMGTITKAKENSFKDSMYGILKSADNYTAEILLENENTYQGETITLPEAGNKKLNYKGQDNINGKVVIDLFGKISMKANNGTNCFYKNANEKEIQKFNGNCDKLENYQGIWKVPTDEKYFKIANDGESNAIIIGYDIAGGTDVVIPYQINGRTINRVGRISVNVFDDRPFLRKGLTSVLIPDTVYLIDSSAFADNALKEVILPSSLNSFWNNSFAYNRLEKVEFTGKLPAVLSAEIFSKNPKLLKPNTIKVPKTLLNSYKTAQSKYGHDAKETWFGSDATENALEAFYE